MSATVGARFELGQVVATPGVLEALARNGQDTHEFLASHAVGVWGDLSEEDKADNDWAVNNDARLLSAYHLKDTTKIWIVTEADRSVTTLLLPEEY